MDKNAQNNAPKPLNGIVAAQEAARGSTERHIKRAKPLWRRLLTLFALFFLVTALGLAAFLGWALQSTSGQSWLLREFNLALNMAEQPLRINLNTLSGALPFNIKLGLELADAQGVWLKAPRIELVWNWRKLPFEIEIALLKLDDLSLERLPELPPDPKPAARTFAFRDLQGLLNEIVRFELSPPAWLPGFSLKALAINNARIAPGLFAPENSSEASQAKSPRLDASGKFLFAQAKLELDFATRLQSPECLQIQALEFSGAGLNIELKAKPEPGQKALTAKASIRAELDKANLRLSGLPDQLLGPKAELEANLEARLETEAEQLTALSLKVAGPKLQAGLIQGNGKGEWHSGPNWAAPSLDGPASYSLNLRLDNPAPDPATPSPVDEEQSESLLAMLKAPLSLDFSLAGDLPKADLELLLSLPELQEHDHEVKDLKCRLSGQDITLALDNAEQENKLQLEFAAMLDGHNAKASASIIGKTRAEQRTIYLRDLKILAAGIAVSGELETNFSPDSPPLLNGAFKLNVADWAALSALAPGYKLGGALETDIVFASGGAEAFAAMQDKTKGQNAVLDLHIPRLSVSEQSGKKLLSLSGLTLSAKLADLFAKPALAGELALDAIQAAQIKSSARFSLMGSLSGPLEARLESQGSIASKLALRWSPGKIELDRLEMNMLLPEAKAGKLRPGLRSLNAAEILYGPQGLSFKGLNLEFRPSGRLSLEGMLAPEQLGLTLKLTGLDFKGWRSLFPQIPEGAADLQANLQGKPQNPKGQFRLTLKEVRIPAIPLAPMNLSMLGAIGQDGSGTSLTSRLEIAARSLKALGAEKAALKMRLPLRFSAQGLPAINMNGPLAAQVQWSGAIGPLWNLLPLADRRLNGRIALDFNASGTPKKPRLMGEAKIDKGRFEDLLLGILLTEITLRLKLAEAPKSAPKAGKAFPDFLPEKALILLTATDGRGGKLKIDGSAGLNGGDLNLATTIDHLRPLRRRDVQIELSGQVKASGHVQTPEIAGEIIINQGELLLNNIYPSASVKTLTITPVQNPKTKVAQSSPRGVTKEVARSNTAQASQDAAGSLNLRLRMLPRFVVEGRGLSSIWQANLLISGSLKDPQITGQITAVKGNFDFLGKNFALSRGSINFVGGAYSDPLLDLMLTNETPELNAHLLVTGPVSKMKLGLSSEPALPRDEILSRVLFGRSVNELGRLEALQLAAAVAQLAGYGSGGGGLFSSAKKALGVDVLRLGTSNTGAAGQPGDQSAAGTTLEMGKYINDMIYMGIQQGMKPDSTALIIQLELTPRSSLELRSEGNNTWGGFKWKYNY